MLKIVVYDTNKEEALSLREKIKEVFINNGVSFQMYTYYTSPKVILENLQKNAYEYDILCLSLNKTDTYAMQIARQLRKENEYSAVIFISITGDIVFDVLKYRPSAFYLKPLNTEALSSYVRELTFTLRKSKRYFTIRNKEILARIPYKSIDCFESRLKIVRMYLNDEKLSEKAFTAKLDDVHKKLPAADFIRCHQSYIINLENVRYLDRAKKLFVMHSGREVYISKRCYPKVLEQFIEYQNQQNAEYAF